MDNKGKLVARAFSLSPQIGTSHMTVRTTIAKMCKEIVKKKVVLKKMSAWGVHYHCFCSINPFISVICVLEDDVIT